MTAGQEHVGLGFSITEMWAWVAHHGEGDEGVVGVTLPSGQSFPLAVADPEMLPKLRFFALEAVAQTGYPATLKHFKYDETIETIAPGQLWADRNGKAT